MEAGLVFCALLRGNGRTHYPSKSGGGVLCFRAWVSDLATRLEFTSSAGRSLTSA